MTAATSVMIVKAQIDGDMRRFNVELPEDAEATESLQAIQTAVAQAFDMEAASLPALKYQDPEGDMCTLVAASLDDMLELNNRGTLRLFASKGGPAVTEAVAPAPSTPKSPVLTVEKTAELSIAPDEVVPTAQAAPSTWVSGQSVDDEVVKPAPQAEVTEDAPLPPQEERPEQWGHELPEDPIEASVVGTWHYGSPTKTYKIRDLHGKLIFEERTISQGELIADGDWLVATLAKPCGEAHGTIRLRYDSGKIVSAFRKKDEVWGDDVIATNEALFGDKGGKDADKKKKKSAGNQRRASSKRNEAAFQPRSDDEVRAAIKQWEQYAHPRSREFFASPEMLEEVLTQLARGIDKTDDPVLGADEKCVYWYGDVTKDDLQAAIRMVKPGESAESVTYVNRVLAFIFATDDSFEQLMKLPKEPFKMSCGDQLCVHLAHVSLASDDEAVVETQEEPEQPTQEHPQKHNTESPEEQTHEEQQQEQNTESTEDLEEVAMLMAMGFSREQALQALQDAEGNVELAVEYLLNGRRGRTPLGKLERKVRALPGNVTEQLRKLQVQLREVVTNMQQHRVRMQERFQASRTQAQESEHMESLQAALEEIKGRLREFRQMAQAALKKASGSVPDAQEQEQLEKVEAQLAEAQRFVSETLATLHARGSEVLQSATSNTAEAASSEVPEASEGAADGADIASVVMETMDAAATAAVDAAEIAMATVDEMLFPEDDAAPDAASSFPPAGYTPEAAPEAPRPSIAKATVMDHAQVFLSQSISAIRSQASALRQPNRNDNWVDIPPTTFAAEEAAPNPADTSLLQSALHPVGEGEGAHAVPAPTFQGSPDNTSLDEFLLVTAVTDAATPETQDNASLMHEP